MSTAIATEQCNHCLGDVHTSLPGHTPCSHNSSCCSVVKFWYTVSLCKTGNNQSWSTQVVQHIILQHAESYRLRICKQMVYCLLSSLHAKVAHFMVVYPATDPGSAVQCVTWQADVSRLLPAQHDKLLSEVHLVPVLFLVAGKCLGPLEKRRPHDDSPGRTWQQSSDTGLQGSLLNVHSSAASARQQPSACQIGPSPAQHSTAQHSTAGISLSQQQPQQSIINVTLADSFVEPRKTFLKSSVWVVTTSALQKTMSSNIQRTHIHKTSSQKQQRYCAHIDKQHFEMAISRTGDTSMMAACLGRNIYKAIAAP